MSGTGGMAPYGDVVDQYAAFAVHCHGESATFEAWAQGVVGDPEVQAWIGGLPGLKKQPNLVFAAARWHGVQAPGPYDGLHDALLSDDAAGGPIRATVLARSTQTNEVGRLATLLPAFRLAAGDRPLALLEAGASAGLNLYPDRWGYAWSTPEGRIDVGRAPRLPCAVTGSPPLPDAPPDVAWRGGIDLNPLDVTDADEMRWLETLVWPEEDARRVRLRQAVEVARADPPALVRGDLLEELPALVDQASAYGEVVVFHTAVAAYLADEDRARLADLMLGLVAEGRCHWVSNESPRVLPGVTATAPETPEGRFVLGVDGQAVAFTHGHGQALDWLPPR